MPLAYLAIQDCKQEMLRLITSYNNRDCNTIPSRAFEDMANGIDGNAEPGLLDIIRKSCWRLHNPWPLPGRRDDRREEFKTNYAQEIRLRSVSRFLQATFVVEGEVEDCAVFQYLGFVIRILQASCYFTSSTRCYDSLVAPFAQEAALTYVEACYPA